MRTERRSRLGGLKRSVVSGGLALASLLGAAGCEDLLGQTDGFSDEEWEAIRKIEPLKGPQLVNPYNKYADSEAAAVLGQMMFFDTAFSTPIKWDGLSTGTKGTAGKVACVTCHDPLHSWVDSRPNNTMSHGTGVTTRNTPQLVNIGYYKLFTWAGRLDSISTQGANAPEAATDVGTTRLMFAHVAYKKYRDEFKAVFDFDLDPALDPALDPMSAEAKRFPPTGRPKANAMAADGPWEAMAAEDKVHVNRIMSFAGKAFEAFERKLVSKDSEFQKYVKGDHSRLTYDQKEGLRLFINKGACIDCHSGPTLTDNSFHNIGVSSAIPQTPISGSDPARATNDSGRSVDVGLQISNGLNGASMYSDNPDEGKKVVDFWQPYTVAGSAKNAQLLGVYRTAQLTNIADTAPYFHNGSVKTLEDVVHFYNVGGGVLGTFVGEKDTKIRPLGLSTREERQLAAFLVSLTGGLVEERWRLNTAKP